MKIILSIFKWLFNLFLGKKQPSPYTGDLQTDINTVKEDTQKQQEKIKTEVIVEQQKLNENVATVNDAVEEKDLDTSLDELAALAKKKKDQQQ